MKNKNVDNWIDDIIKQHKTQLDNIKKNRNNYDEIEDRTNLNWKNTEEKVNWYVESDINNHEPTNNNKYFNIKDNITIDSSKEEEKVNISGFGKVNQSNIRYQDKNLDKMNYSNKLTDYSKKNDPNEFEDLMNELRELRIDKERLSIENEKLFNENNIIKNKLDNLRNITNIEREKEMIDYIQKLENEKFEIEDKLNKLVMQDKIKSQEIELMHQKLRDYDLIHEENSNQQLDSIKQLKIEMEEFKNKSLEFEKIIDILNYFFKKMNTYYGKNREKSNTLTAKSLQNKLIELENYIAKITTDRINLNQKYSKVLNNQNKITQNESYDSYVTVDAVKKMNDKISELSEENKSLRSKINDVIKSSMEISNNEIKVNKPDNEISDNYKRLEMRVLDLEKELYKKKRKEIKEIEINNKNMNCIERDKTPVSKKRFESTGRTIIKSSSGLMKKKNVKK